jgi:hypothetical protein
LAYIAAEHFFRIVLSVYPLISLLHPSKQTKYQDSKMSKIVHPYNNDGVVILNSDQKEANTNLPISTPKTNTPITNKRSSLITTTTASTTSITTTTTTMNSNSNNAIKINNNQLNRSSPYKSKHISVQLSDLSQLTLNESTLNSSDNDLLLDPINFDEIPNSIIMGNYNIYEIDSQKSMNLNLSNYDKTDLEIDDLHDFLKIDNNNNNNNNKLKDINTSNSNSTDYLSITSNLDTPTSKILNNNDISFDNLKRSFTRLKQTSELINTERVYICSLKILENVYLNNFISDTSTPIYFETFRNYIIKLLKNHQKLYNNLVKIYTKWYNDSRVFIELESEKNKNNDIHSVSPDFEKFNYVSNEKYYLETIINLLSNDSIDVETYSNYCSLYHRILKFSNLHEIEKYKRNSLIILNDYLVEQKNFQTDYFVDKHLDTRFISVVQMPTNRMVRYKLILQSLLKNIELDEKNTLQLIHYEKSLDKINMKINEINSFVGNEEIKLKKLDKFKSLFNKYDNKSIFLNNKYFLENLEDLQLASSFGVIFNQNSKNNLYSDYLCGFLFKSHLVLAKNSNIHSNSLDIKFIIPLMSIFNLENSSFNLSTNYDHTLALLFEDKFNIYEIILIFPNEKEQLLWRGNLKINLNKLDYNINDLIFNQNNENNSYNHNFFYSDIQRKILTIDIDDEIEKFNIFSYIPHNINSIKQFNKNKNSKCKNNEISYFEVDHFMSDLNNSPKNRNSIVLTENNNDNSEISSISTKSPVSNININTTNNNKVQIIKISLQERVACQTCINSVWSKQFEIYNLNISISRSLSNMFHSKISLLSLSNTPTTPSNSSFIPPSPSFVNNNGLLGSPIKLRNSKSMRTIKDFNSRVPTSSADSTKNNESESFNFTPPRLIKHDSLMSLSNILTNNVNSSSAKSIISSSTVDMNRSNSIQSSQTQIQTQNSKSQASTKKSRGVSRFWKNFKSRNKS